MSDWIGTLLSVRRAGPEGGDAEIRQSMVRAAADMFATGTVLAGDISNTLQSPPVLLQAGISGIVFYELPGFAEADPARAVRDAWERISRLPDGLRYSVVAHAPYSVSPALFKEIVRRTGSEIAQRAPR